MKGGVFGVDRHTSAPPATASRSLGAVKSRIDTGRNDNPKVEPFLGHANRSSSGRNANVIERPKKMSFKQRRESFKMDSFRTDS